MKLKVFSKGLTGLIIWSFLMMFLGGIAMADLIWEPNDDFYFKHKENCNYIGGREFTGNAPDGSIIIWKSPKSKEKIAEYDNGTVFPVSYTYTDSKMNLWGIIEKDGITGWTRMDELVLVYDNIAFCEEHESEFKKYNGKFDDYVPKSDIILWSYPGSGQTVGSIDKLEEYHGIIFTYTDAEQRIWGYYNFKDLHISSLKETYTNARGNSSVWICISDPEDKNIPASTVTPPAAINSSDDVQASSTSGFNGNSAYLLLAAAVVILIAVTAILIRLFWTKNKRQQ